MLRTIEAVIDERGRVRLLEPLPLGAVRRALVTVLEEPPYMAEAALGTELLSEAALAEDWLRPEEEEAWSHLQPARSS